MSRPRGFIESWRPQQGTRDLLQQVETVLDEYADFLPLTIRQVFYRLVGKFGYDKTEAGYSRLCEVLNRARRARMIPMESLRDDGFTFDQFQGWSSAADWISATVAEAADLRLDRQIGQDIRVMLWCEAQGMVPQIQRVAGPYSIPVASSGGFDSTTAKHSMARKITELGPTMVLHIGDHDPSGVHMFDSLAEDVTAFVEHFDGVVWFERIAITPAQIEQYQLPTAPAKPGDRRRFDGETTQAEALDPAVLASIVKTNIDRFIDIDTFHQRVMMERELQDQLSARLQQTFSEEL